MNGAALHERWNDRSDPAATATIPELFQRSVHAHPDAIALVDGGRRLTYRELSLKAAQLAHHLRDAGIGTEDIVGICLLRSAEMVVGVLAVVMAGGAFVPVDPAWPASRRESVVTDAAVRVCLVAPDGPMTAPATALVVDLDDWGFGDRPAEPPRPTISGSQLAYVIFTSGSTGTPKGAMIRHEAICERLLWQRDVVLGFGAGDASLFKAPLAFDISINEILLPLISGGRVVLAAPGSEKDPDYLLDLIAAEHVTFLYLVSSMLDAMLALDLERAARGASALGDVTHIWCGGEVLTPALFDRFRRQLTTTLYHGYGPAEATIGVSHVIYRDTAERIATSIGRPNPHTQLYVLDDTLTPTAPGVGGELYAAGFLLGRGYVGSPTLTASAFVANPFDPSGSRMYRTGDLARWTDDGMLEFLGRADNQVKIGGRRVELEEIEAQVSQHPSVARAVVTQVRARSGADALAGYVTAMAGRTIDVDELRAWCGIHLPDYMVPATLIALEHLPLTANGKVDRRALPDPHAAPPTASDAGPRSADETAVCAAFAQVLGVADIAVDDDFFALGGDSIVAVRLVLALRAAGYAARAKDVATARTPRQLAVAIAAAPPAPAPGLEIALIDLDQTDAADLAAASPGLRRVLPLTAVQAGILFLSLSVPEGGHDPYIVQQVVDLDGPLDADRLRRATHAVIERHDALAAGFHVTRSGRLVSAIDAADAPAFRTLLVAGDDPDAFVSRIAREERDRGFDLARPPLMRYTLVSLGPERHRLVQTVHHLIADGWSVALIWDDILTAYRGEAFAQPAPQSDAFLRWWTHGRDRPRELSAWKTYLDGVEAPLLLADHLPPAAFASPGDGFGRRRRALNDAQRTALRTYARARSVSEGAVLTAAWGLTLGAVIAGTDVVFGSTAAGRGEDVEGIERIVGMLLNTVTTRVRWSARDTLDDVVTRFAEGEAAVLDHPHLPLADVHAALGVRELFDSLFSIENLQRPAETVDAGGLRLGEIEYLQAPHYRLTALVTLHEKVSVAVTNDRGHIDDALADRLAETYLRIIGLIVEGTTSLAVMVLAAAWMPAAEAGAVATGAAVAAGERPQRSATLDGLLRARAAASPASVAVIDDETGAQTSAADLDAQVNAFAALLHAAGVSVGDRVAVVLPRSTELVIVLAGILRAGAAYVPIDPDYPPARVAAILDDAAPALVVTDAASLGERLAADRGLAGASGSHGSGVLRIDEPAVRAALRLGIPTPPALDRPLAADDTACVIFTSGTTGRPKGVALSHRALASRLTWGASRLGLDETSVALAKSGLGFVDAATELLGPLTAGARVVVVPDRTARDPDALAATVHRHGVTHLLTVPGLAEAIAGVADAPTALHSLRVWVTSGEALPPQTARAIVQAAPGAALHNFYGSTEITGDATVEDVITGPKGASPDGTIDRVLIGAPVPNTVARVLDAWLRPVAPGVVGELYVGGVQLAGGYIGRAALTAERFVADPLGRNGDRLYRTGDLVRADSDGRLDYLGRADDQLKIRGMRVELGEVRSAVAQHPSVSDAAVLAVPHPSGGVLLAAYVVADADDDAVLEDAVRAHASALLPEYMVPSAIVRLDALPVTANGKLDRRALPVPDLSAGGGARGRAPESDGELAVAAVFREVLHLDAGAPLGVDDDFFRLGGDSILSIQVVRQARQRGLELTIHDVFALRTPARLAAGRELRIPGAEASAAPTTPAAIAVTPSIVQQRLRLSGMPLETCVYTEVVELDRLPDAASVRAAVDALLHAVDGLRQRVTPTHRLLWTTDIDAHTPAHADAAVTVDDCSPLSADEVIARLRRDAVARVDVVTAGRALQVAVATSQQGAHLLVAAHGLVADRRSLHRITTYLGEVLRHGATPTFASAPPAGETTGLLTDAAHSPASEAALSEGLDQVLALSAGARTRAGAEAGGAASAPALATRILAGPAPAPAALEAAFLAAIARAEGADTVVDVEVDLRAHLGPDSEQTPGALTGVAPRRAADHSMPSPAYDPWHDLWRYAHTTARKKLRRSGTASVLIMRIYGRTPDPTVAEGFESLYRVVARYAITPAGTELHVRGSDDPERLIEYWADEIGARTPAARAQS
ncbi:non-ribosomal peptide synthetase [Microbacterium sp. VKM Ac-2923]|uniref:non-ribosomal peptide synthetase n=1 Tax=Microbacterium sp. VKM Ac-2923 TaxID=2929476 RepID=UPI001FB3E272|nr:non-ribosomal peptide synthetase [Microbacterium sp. VKM Ac-2923]MCJ1708518.1 amino acid adenylation domain-containing protein [Microbacterium sp. VKM Ac-2923]